MLLEEFIGKKLREARESANYTQLTVCKQLQLIQGKKGLTQANLSKLESGRRKNIDIFLLATLATFYEKPITFFLPKKLWQNQFFLNHFKKELNKH